MWTDDLDVVESCDFYHSLSNFDSIDSIGVCAVSSIHQWISRQYNRVWNNSMNRKKNATTSNLAYMKAPIGMSVN